MVVLGGGSNVLVGDGGMRGVVVRLRRRFRRGRACRPRATPRSIVEAGGSAGMAAVTAKAASAGAAGIGSLAGIPGTVGGSLRMNAGTDREMGEFVAAGLGAIAERGPSRTAWTCSISTATRRWRATSVVSRVTLGFAQRRARTTVRERDAERGWCDARDAADRAAQRGLVLSQPGRRQGGAAHRGGRR